MFPALLVLGIPLPELLLTLIDPFERFTILPAIVTGPASSKVSTLRVLITGNSPGSSAYEPENVTVFLAVTVTDPGWTRPIFGSVARSKEPASTSVKTADLVNVTSLPAIVTSPPLPGAEASVPINVSINESGPFVWSVTAPPSPPADKALAS